jgi:hypothetical protein
MTLFCKVLLTSFLFGFPLSFLGIFFDSWFDWGFLLVRLGLIMISIPLIYGLFLLFYKTVWMIWS